MQKDFARQFAREMARGIVRTSDYILDFTGGNVGPFTFTRSTVKNTLNSTSSLTQYAVDTPAFSWEYNGSGYDGLGLDLEGGRTNLARYSCDFSNGVWTTFGATVGADTTDSIFGTGYKRGIVNDTGATLGNTRQAITVANNSNPHTVLAIVQTGTSNIHALSIDYSGGTGQHGGICFSSADGTKTDITAFAGVSATATPSQSKVTRISGDIWFVEVTIANNSTGNTTMTPRFYPAPATSVVGTIGNSATGTAYLHYLGVEQASFASSPIITTSGALARGGDNCVPYDLSRTNYIRNSVAAGASVGVAPTNWSTTGTTAGVTRTPLYSLTIDGVDGYVYNIAGTGTSANGFLIQTETSTSAIAAAASQTWAHGVKMAVIRNNGAAMQFNVGIETINTGSRVDLLRGVTFNTGDLTGTPSVKTTVKTASSSTISNVRPTIECTIANSTYYDFDIWIAQPQLERRPLSTSTATAYIPTSGSAVTVYDGPINFNPVEGTFIVEFETSNTVVNSGGWRVLSVSDGGTSNEIYMGGANPGTELQATFAGVTNTASTLAVAGTTYKMALAYKTGDNEVYLNGSQYSGILFRGSSVPSGMTQLILGNRAAGDRAGYVRIKRWTYVPIRLPNAELDARTAV